MSDLNIRAAKALGWKKDDIALNCFRVPRELNTSITNDLMPARTMKFTTSYDWAMLGLKEFPDGEWHLIAERLLNSFGDSILSTADPLNYHSIRDLFQLTPEQITQAWVEVLEAQ